MANAYSTNFTLASASELFSAVWKLTRCLLAAGWHYKASGNGQSSGTKDSSSNAQFDQWQVGGAVNLSSASRGSGSGTGVSIAAASASTGLAVISGVSGFTANSVQDYLTITGSAASGGPGTSATNNGSWRITAQTGTTVTVYAPGLVAEVTNASLTVTEQYGGATASITTFTTTTSGQSTLINVTGLSGLSSADIGRYLVIINAASAANNGSWYIVSVGSASTCTIYNPNAVASDANNGSIQWTEFNPLTSVYPSYLQAANGQGAWLDLQGPTIVKIPLAGAAPTGSFIRGENVTQTTTGAQGECLGVVTDTGGGTGFMVIAPRVVGTGAQAGAVATYGWNSSANPDTITGGFSGATINTPVSGSVPIAYISETVWNKSTANDGYIFHQRIDQNSSTESATSTTTGRFSTMANTLSQVTSIVPPGGSTGGSPATNGFAAAWTGTYVVAGTGGNGSSTATNAGYWIYNAPTSPGKAQLLAANNIEQQGISQDGSWLYLQSCNSAGFQCSSYLRMDNQEDGDLDPYVHQGHWAGPISSAATRTQDDGASAGSATDNMNTGQAWINGPATNHGFKGFRRRGLSGETYNYFSPAILYDFGATVFPLTTNTGNPDQVGTASVTTYVRDQLWLYLTPYTAQLATGRMRKGTPRWLQLCQGPAVLSTFDSEQWIVLSANSSNTCFVAGPYDGATTPSF